MNGYLRTVALRTLLPPTSIRPRAAARFETFVAAPVEGLPVDAERERNRVVEPPAKEPGESRIGGEPAPASVAAEMGARGARPAPPAPDRDPGEARFPAAIRGGVAAVEDEPASLARPENGTRGRAPADVPGGETLSRASCPTGGEPGRVAASGVDGGNGAREDRRNIDPSPEARRPSGARIQLPRRLDEDAATSRVAEGEVSPSREPGTSAPDGSPAADHPGPAGVSVLPEIAPAPTRAVAQSRRTRALSDGGPTITVTIGRIDVKAPRPEGLREDTRTIERPGVTLDDYLTRRDGGERT